MHISYAWPALFCTSQSCTYGVIVMWIKKAPHIKGIHIVFIHTSIYGLNISFGGPNVAKKNQIWLFNFGRGSTESGLIREGSALPTSACHALVRSKGIFFLCLLRPAIQMFVTFCIPKEFALWSSMEARRVLPVVSNFTYSSISVWSVNFGQINQRMIKLGT
jgi:hypothetical protein